MERRRARLDLADPMTKTVRRRDRPRERWLLTRKTWRYMADAGRRLVPDGASARADDVPRLEAYFQEVCAREPRFLLLRKSSYPGVLPKPRRKKRARGGSVRARSPSDDAPPPARPADLRVAHTSGGRFDIAKLRRDFFAAPPPPPSPSAFPAPRDRFGVFRNGCSRPAPAQDDEGALVDLLRKYLKVEDDEGPTSRLTESEELLRALRSYLERQAERGPADSDADPAQRILREHLGRYYQRSARDNTVPDFLSDRNLLKKLYNDLRKTKPYRGGRGGAGAGGGGGGGGGFGPTVGFSGASSRSAFRGFGAGVSRFGDGEYAQSPPLSPPPLIEVLCESLEEPLSDAGTQTAPVPEEVLQELERAYREKLEAATTSPTSPTSPPPERRPRRRSSVDHDDVSQSVSDTIKRYLRMARKKSVDSDKADRFKRINYDKNLRNIKPRAPGDVDDDGPHKGCQTEEAWVPSYREAQASVASTPTSPPSPSQSHSFLSTLLGRGAAPAPLTACVVAGGMQKSRSSSSVVQSVSKRLWRTRSRSSSRVAAAWTPQGSCCWADGSGRCVRLADTSLLSLTEVERRALQQAALARLQQLNLGTPIKIPEDNTAAVAPKPKRRAYLLKRKALTTGFFDQSRAKDADKEKEPMGNVFGVPLSQCVETERALRRHGGSRASLASLTTLDKADDSESCDSGEWGWSGLEDGGGPRVPAIVSACLNHLRRHGLHTLGLFRVSSSKKRVRQLREEWERGTETALDAAVSPHDVAALLKEFLRDLPDPLLCKDLYPAFLQTQKIRNRRLQWEALRLIVQLLPAAHRDTLNALLSFLAQLAANADDDREPGNRMTAANLATIFAPNILHRNNPNEPSSAEQLLSERADVINVVRQLVERHTELWALPAELLHEAYIHLAHSAPSHLDSLLMRRAECAAESNANAEGAKRLWSRESFLHAAANTATVGSSPNARIRSSEDRGSSGIVSSPPRDSAPDSNDSASDYNETGNASEDDCVITASLHIPAIRPRRRSTSGSSSSAKRDSAVGSSAASPSPASSASPPSSPPPRPERRHAADIERLVAFGRERNTSDARAVVVKQHDETTVTRTRVSSRQEHALRREENPRREDNITHNVRRDDATSAITHIIRREEPVTRRLENAMSKRDEPNTRIEQIVRTNDHNVKREDQSVRREDQNVRREDQNVRREDTQTGRREERREGVLYKRGELISSAQSRQT